jgi:hypothetical protein
LVFQNHNKKEKSTGHDHEVKAEMEGTLAVEKKGFGSKI